MSSSCLQVREGLYYNPYFPGGAIAMPKMLADDGTEYDDGTAATEAQQAKESCFVLKLDLQHLLFASAACVSSRLHNWRIWLPALLGQPCIQQECQDSVAHMTASRLWCAGITQACCVVTRVSQESLFGHAGCDSVLVMGS